MVCPQWRNICKDPSMWRSIDTGNLGNINLYRMSYFLKMSTEAVDRSCGGLVDITIDFFCNDWLLSYIGQRASNLRRLRLVSCWIITDEGLSETAKKFPLLEELEIYYCNTGKNAIEAVGPCCPLLKTFKFDQVGVKNSSLMNDEEALAIAKNMHGLRHLQLIGNKLTNQGLQAILDGCPYLESLDLRKCFHVDLEGDMGKRCAERIKNLRCPNDSTHDYEFIVEVNHDDDYDLGGDDYDDYFDNSLASLAYRDYCTL